MANTPDPSSDEAYDKVFRQILSIPTDDLSILLEGNKDNKDIAKMIRAEIKERKNGATRIGMIEEALGM